MSPPQQTRRALICRLKREQFIVEQARDEHDAAYRRGWNARAQSLITDLGFDVSDVQESD